MGDDIAIKVDNVSKKFCRTLKRSMVYGIKDIARNTLGLSSRSHLLRDGEFWAVDNVSFTVKKGETLGIIGPNGSGKSTILKMLNGIFWPDRGKITVRGRVGALIEVAAGFHPMLTGRENVYLNGAILGMGREEVEAKFDDIVAFADIGDFINTPVKFYSSGMFVRLGFSVAAHCNPDILLVDEVLAVGDAAFVEKCSDRINKLLDGGMTLILVSHNQSLVNTLCSRCLVLDKGQGIIETDSTAAIRAYEAMLLELDASQGTSRTGSVVNRSKCILTNHRITDENGVEQEIYPIGGKIRYSFEYRLDPDLDLSKVQFYLGLMQVKERFHIARYKNTLDGFTLKHHEGRMEFTIDTNLTSGNYFFTINFTYGEVQHLAIQYSPRFRVLHPTLPKIDKEYFGRFLLEPNVKVFSLTTSK